MGSRVKESEVEALKKVVRKVFEYKPSAKDRGRKQVEQGKVAKHRRGAGMKEKAAKTG